MATWSKEVTWADTQIDTISKLKKRDSVDEQVLKDLREARKVLQTALDSAALMKDLMAAWPEFQKTHVMTAELADRVRGTFVEKWLNLEVALRQVALTAEAVYERYPEEADSRSTENEVGRAVKRLAPAAVKPAPTAP